MLKRSLAGLDDTPINQACRTSLRCASDSGDRGEAANKGREIRDNVKRASVETALWSDSFLWRSLSGDYSLPTSVRFVSALPTEPPKQSPVGLVPFQRKLLHVLFTSFKNFLMVYLFEMDLYYALWLVWSSIA